MAIRRLVVAAVAAVMVVNVANAEVPPFDGFGRCPFDLAAQSGGGYPSGATLNTAYPNTTEWTDRPVRWVILDGHAGDPYQYGPIYVKTADGWVKTPDGSAMKPFGYYESSKARNVGMLVDLGTLATHGVQIVADTPLPEDAPAGTRQLSRLGHADFLTIDPGVNLAGGATMDVANGYGAKAIGDGAWQSGSSPDNLFDGMDGGASAYWRGNSSSPEVLTERYVGVVFDSPVTVAALRINFSSNDNAGQNGWKDFYLEILLPNETTDWVRLGQASAANSDYCYWVDMGEMKVSGIRLYGCSEFEEDEEGNRVYVGPGNNPYYGANRIVAELQVWSGVPVPEPATMTLLAMGGLAMLRRRT